MLHIGEDCILWLAKIFDYNFERALLEIRQIPRPFILMIIGFYLWKKKILLNHKYSNNYFFFIYSILIIILLKKFKAI